ncbi:hypothetical protein CFP56_032696 [Quercus suber]|uniref:Uncharacterized protein n=1 Tax=Quercus suber TaxID=58331 RepID=A0AAW0JGF8_QUESU
MGETNVNLKLLINTESHGVLLAEAGKDFIDFLIHIVALPVGTFILLLKKQGMVGSLGSIYESIENMSMATATTPPAILKNIWLDRDKPHYRIHSKNKRQISLIVCNNNNGLLKPHFSVLPPI